MDWNKRLKIDEIPPTWSLIHQPNGLFACFNEQSGSFTYWNLFYREAVSIAHAHALSWEEAERRTQQALRAGEGRWKKATQRANKGLVRRETVRDEMLFRAKEGMGWARRWPIDCHHPWWLVDQPNGFFARFCKEETLFTHYNMTKTEARGICAASEEEWGCPQIEEALQLALDSGEALWQQALDLIKNRHGEEEAWSWMQSTTDVFAGQEDPLPLLPAPSPVIRTSRFS
jgi:hypothetical protein